VRRARPGATPMNLLVSTVAMAVGALVAAFPANAARIWGSEKLAELAPSQRASFLRWYRAFGVLLCLGGILLAVDSIAFSNCHP
jgi:hypothetical protein